MILIEPKRATFVHKEYRAETFLSDSLCFLDCWSEISSCSGRSIFFIEHDSELDQQVIRGKQASTSNWPATFIMERKKVSGNIGRWRAPIITNNVTLKENS